mgnify:FL=1
MKNQNNQQYKSILLVLFLGFLWITFNQTGIIKFIQLNKEKKQLTNEVKILEQEEKFIKNNIIQLTNNLEYIEFLAYSKYKMVHKDETIYPHDKIYRIKDQKNPINP